MAQDQAVKQIIRVYGVVQGVGFRPFVARLASEQGIRGTVRNAGGHVEIVAIAPPEPLARFINDIQACKPQGSMITALDYERVSLAAPLPSPGFAILGSEAARGGLVMPTPDLAVCEDCLREMQTPGDPRYANPFISCTHCGPRFSIMAGVPYDRGRTSMEGFPLCPLCAAQYADPVDRRYHAQTLCCNACGPTLSFQDRQGQAYGHPALAQAISLLKAGAIVAVKGIGGYHLACSPCDEGALARLRHMKGREHKPFAVLYAHIASLKAYCEVSPEEETLLQTPARPIVLLRRKISPIHPLVYTTSPDLGAFLAYTPLQHLLLEHTGPLVMTSANPSALPLIHDDGEMAAFYHSHPGLAGVLGHDRPILRPLDDSVAMVVRGQTTLLRRARGYAPLGLPLALDGPPLVAFGAQEKSAVCLYRNGYVSISAETGELDNSQTLAVYQRTLADFQHMLGITPALGACDLHPGYASTQAALASGLPLVQVQHHHAHVASVMAEHNLPGPVIGVAFDGTGYGLDGTVWGGEFLITMPGRFTRAAHLKPITLLGGDESVRQGWKTGACLLHDAELPMGDDPRLGLVRAALDHGVNTLRSSSMGRVFDGVSALLGICQTSQYGGQCAIALEHAATGVDPVKAADIGPFPFDLLSGQGALVADLAPCIRDMHARHQGGGDVNALALGFHITVAHLIAQVCQRLSQEHGIHTAALSGGVFANRLLLSYTVPLLQGAGLTVYCNHHVPPGDGGIALGQALVALASQVETEQEGSDSYVHRRTR